MASAINSDNGVVSGTAGLKSSADSSGVLDLQTNGTTAISISASQVVSFANQPTYTGGTANGVMFLNGSKAVTTGTALVFDGANLGVGVTPSAWATVTGLQVKNASLYGFGNEGGLYANAYYNASWKYIANGAATGYDSNATTGQHRWFNAPSGTAGNTITFTQAMTLDASGNFGLGTIPSAWGGPFDAMQLGTYGQHIAGQTNTADLKLGTNNYYNGSNYVYTVTGFTAMQINLGQGVFNVSAAPSGTAGATATLTEIIAVASGQSLALQGATSQSGTGITFPASQNASSNANTLDDYEEGTWTPTAVTAGYTVSASSGFYTKTGRVVTLLWNMLFSAVPASNSDILIGGAPFSSGVGASGNCSPGVCRENSAVGAIYVTNIQNNGLPTLELNSMDGVNAGSQRTIRTGETYSCSLTFFTS